MTTPPTPAALSSDDLDDMQERLDGGNPMTIYEAAPKMARLLMAEVRRLASQLASAEYEALAVSQFAVALAEGLDCGDNSCMFKARGKGGMRTNGGCRCLGEGPTLKKRKALELAKKIVTTASGAGKGARDGG
jgi:hypothetical protein